MLGAREAVARYAGRGDCVVSTIGLNSGTSEGYSFIFKMLCNAGDDFVPHRISAIDFWPIYDVKFGALSGVA